jgi:hypothetical protein
MTMGAALLLALLALALATHGRFLRPTGYGLSLAKQVVDARYEAVDLAKQNQELQEVYEFLQTPAGKELAARAEVMALKPGERLIVFKEAAHKATQPPDLATRVLNGLDRNARYAQEILQVWSGLGQSPVEASPTKPGAAATGPAPAKGQDKPKAAPTAKQPTQH